MKNITNSEVENQDWWRLNPRKDYTYTIEFTFSYGGLVRAKLDSLSHWGYKKCGIAEYALTAGQKIIESQKKEREAK